ncbi:YggS family pyridoxal phosphate-dependent enzyme [Fonticella tunisiensis]|uniref:Pyridoxal phosphate homeostasis protein n=1 Tax=Fonticella tunisiensis TaxID=1096341 RepID=A0A4R7KSA6_9CLOT|nr:YggS family pyridoxal phosphate-dependent enzyme [Fonticella tunisiensis]TDT61838.1 hypothetical protein EDD71_10516 [Fonticella tunisiensis]
MSVSNNISRVRERIELAAMRAGRQPEDIELVAVSKMQSLEKMYEAKECGLRVFGENKVQELLDKYDKIQDVKWHFIGHLQTNKVKYIIDKVEMIHSLDRIGLVEEIDKRAKQINRIMPVLIQINIGREETKSGIYEEDVENFISGLEKYQNILVSGIMTIPPPSDNKSEIRGYFRRVKKIFDDLKQYKYKNFDIKYLSMGMTNDFEIAIEEGANIIRVGTGIFGQRNYL